MGTERAVSFLRLTAPLLAGLALLGPGPAQAGSSSPDAPPGSSGLRPDPAPAGAARPAPVHRTVVTAPRIVIRQPVSRPASAPAAVPKPRPAVRPVSRAKPRPKPRPAHRRHPPALLPKLPPIAVMPALAIEPLRQRPPAALAALALALAALTAGSGAGLVFSWSRR